MTIKPLALGPGQKVGIIAPAGPVNREKLHFGLDLLKGLGLKPVLGSHLFKEEGYLAGNDDSRLKDFHTMFKRKSIRAVFCARGGYGSLRLLDRLDYDLIRQNPKIIVGFSDITALLLAIHKKTGLITFHGPLLAGPKGGLENNMRFLMTVLRGEGELSIDLKAAEIYHPGRAEGTLIGGNLSLLVHLIGTAYLPSLDNSILFLEDQRESPYRLDRMMTHLRLAGRLKKVRGVMLGRFEGCGTNKDLEQVWENCLADMDDIPVIHSCPFGHGDENMTLPLGVKARLDTQEMTLKILESPIRVGGVMN